MDHAQSALRFKATLKTTLKCGNVLDVWQHSAHDRGNWRTITERVFRLYCIKRVAAYQRQRKTRRGREVNSGRELQYTRFAGLGIYIQNIGVIERPRLRRVPKRFNGMRILIFFFVLIFGIWAENMGEKREFQLRVGAGSPVCFIGLGCDIGKGFQFQCDSIFRVDQRKNRKLAEMILLSV